MSDVHHRFGFGCDGEGQSQVPWGNDGRENWSRVKLSPSHWGGGGCRVPREGVDFGED